MHSMSAASQGMTMGPSPGNPNSSLEISRSSRKTRVLMYAKGSTNRTRSLEYTTKLPLTGKEEG
ncbi:unnamed protein product [Spirodela intermedia]|uniref:Uncharacterized protein n=1 Tax=Spirodela intermedia TaxID=51605 RepID=A0A7I8KPG7_SPIIN|nr:unnamed protein product [Spirodela intermedia]